MAQNLRRPAGQRAADLPRPATRTVPAERPSSYRVTGSPAGQRSSDFARRDRAPRPSRPPAARLDSGKGGPRAGLHPDASARDHGFPDGSNDGARAESEDTPG